MGLTNKRRAFVEHYLTCWNASEAARRAGYKSRANTAGNRLLSNVDVQAEIQHRLQEMQMDSDEVLTRLAEQARGEGALYVREDGRVDIAALVRDGKAHLVKRIKETKDGRDVEFYDAQAALVHIGRHHVLFTDKYEIDWREEARREGVNPDSVIEQLVKEFTTAMAGSGSGGSVEDSQRQEQGADESA